MDRCCPRRLMWMPLIVLLLRSSTFVCLHGNPDTGVDYLHCVNDYLITINCTVRFTPCENSSDNKTPYWLTFIESYERTKFKCMLKNTNGSYFCSLKTSDPASDDDYYQYLIFGDKDVYEIYLCHSQSGANGTEICDLLNNEYIIADNIKPNAPSCLTVSQQASQHHFTWKSSYEKVGPITALIDNLQYQLHYFTRGDGDNVTSHKIIVDSMYYSVDDENFKPDTEYAARVRSSPNPAVYMGEWSEWSTEVHWRTQPAVNSVPLNTVVSRLSEKILIPLFVIMPLVLLLCYAPVKKWRQSAFIPTPAPYFHTLYSDCQGDFKSWVVTEENTADMLKTEETLKIDTLTKCAELQEEEECQFHHQLMEGSTYSNITDHGCDTSLLGMPYAVMPLSAPGSSLKSLTLSSQPGSPADGDSGCWLCSHTSLERDPPWYCNEYCTLNAFQQPSALKAEHPGSPSTKSCPTGMIEVDGFTEA